MLKSSGHRSTGVLRVINESELGVAPDGRYELVLSRERRPGNWFELDPRVGQIQTRHYFERARPAADDPTLAIPLEIEALDAPGPRPAPDDARSPRASAA